MAYETLDKALGEAETIRADRIAEERVREGQRAKEARAWRAHEKAMLGKKLALSRNILAWTREFAKSKEYERARKLLDNVEIFGGGWGHRPASLGGFGRSCIYLERDGSLRYVAGYKWMGGGQLGDFRMLSEDELAKRLSYSYLKGLHAFLHSDKVWERIGEDLSLYARWG